MPDKSLLFFLLKVISLFFLLLILLYWIIPYYNLLLSMTVEPIMTRLYPHFIYHITAKNELLEVVTHFAVMGQSQSRLAFDIDPLKYAYGLPLFIALLLASSGQWREHVWHIMLGFFVLVAAQTWSLCFDITRHLVFEFNAAYSLHFGYGGLGKTIISLGSQLGFLIFPTLIPVSLWIFFKADYFKQLSYLQK